MTRISTREIESCGLSLVQDSTVMGFVQWGARGFLEPLREISPPKRKKTKVAYSRSVLIKRPRHKLSGFINETADVQLEPTKVGNSRQSFRINPRMRLLTNGNGGLWDKLFTEMRNSVTEEIDSIIRGAHTQA